MGKGHELYTTQLEQYNIPCFDLVPPLLEHAANDTRLDSVNTSRGQIRETSPSSITMSSFQSHQIHIHLIVEHDLLTPVEQILPNFKIFKMAVSFFIIYSYTR